MDRRPDAESPSQLGVKGVVPIKRMSLLNPPALFALADFRVFSVI
jgi:hypothetical protein